MKRAWLVAFFIVLLAGGFNSQSWAFGSRHHGGHGDSGGEDGGFFNFDNSDNFDNGGNFDNGDKDHDGDHGDNDTDDKNLTNVTLNDPIPGGPVVPEPMSIYLLAIGLTGALLLSRKAQ